MAIDISTLNDPQREAVLCTEGPLLVLAGAGSGKTRVLTYRIAHIIESEKAAPWEVLAITFTNKAAAEMRERLGGIIGPRTRGMWVSTFHSMCVRILRADAERLGFSQSFTIYDESDSKRLVKDIMAELDIDPKRFPVNALRNRISTAKNELMTPASFAESAIDPVGKQAARVFARLQERLKAANAFDFDDLLLYAYLLLKHHPEVLQAYQRRFRYILVDEYQDTNHAQYEICRLMAAGHGNLMVVGDDDQSIYSWRGADIRNILEFEKDYPNCTTIKLEQNYRSVGNILEAANAVIANNMTRKPKKLFTSSDAGDKIQVFMASDERDEGRWIAGQIEKRHGAGLGYNQIAVFYRTNAQSRMLEDMFLRAGVPYRIVGGTRFFERQEIQDVMAYLTLIVNPADDMAAQRVINVPRRGVGKTTIERIAQVARENQTTFMNAAELSVVDEELRPASRKAVGEFVQIIRDASTYSGDLRKVVEMVVDKAGLIEALQNEGTDEARGRIENIKEFLGVVDEFKDTHEDDDAEFAAPTASEAEGEEPTRVLRGDSLADFLEWVRLRTDLDSASDDGSAVTLMTIHSSKGLEFDCVFVAGMEESIFPHMNSMGDSAGVEEERRLAYVAITRARKSLYLTCAAQRQIFGSTHANPASRFLHEIPESLRQTTGVGSAGFSGTGWEKRGSRRGISGSGTEAGEGRVFGLSSSFGAGERSRNARTGLSAAAQKKEGAKASFKRGDLVDHKTFGRGRVEKVDGDTLHVYFSKLSQTKKLLKDYAPIVKIEK
ncbi:MAG: DNA helicase UvrD [Coriobacteriaceae bacterium]|jgi:DNA helicase-2/ATP-dependent DNA helicase PcrA|nr:DNA helicase UvrD [Coriobacteriaceae bacterium]